ncbi:hypothetical protein FB451DRAFT_62143 [Mycena latifolia]|nr:hypothetical protein FB451DRAFT_62143 [Mycena latifolia]
MMCACLQACAHQPSYKVAPRQVLWSLTTVVFVPFSFEVDTSDMPPGQVSRGQPGFRSLVKTWWSRIASFDNTFGFKGSSSSSENGSSKSGKSPNDDSSSNDSSSSSDDKSDGSGNGSNSSSSSSSSNGSSGSSNGGSSSSSSSQPSSTKTSSPSPPPPPCVLNCVPDNDPRVRYSPAWSLSSQGFFRTSHETSVVGSWVTFNFNGSAITVYGSVPASNTTHPPPTAVYAIDAATPFTTSEPMASSPILNQPLFSASQLSEDTHTLVINVTAVQAASPFSIDYFIVTPRPSASAKLPESSLATTSSLTKTQPSGATVGILAGVLGSVIFVLLCLSAFFLVIFRRRRQRMQRSKSFQSSLFTTSESILRWNEWGGSAVPSAYSASSAPFRAKPRSIAVSEK